MKVSIRVGTFETNSSSVHSLTITSLDEFNMWKNGDMLFDSYAEKLINKQDADEEYIHSGVYYTFDSYFEEFAGYYETFEHEKKVDGVDVIVFGYFGYGG